MLKTNYQNWIPDENGRKYSLTEDGQGFTKIKDETVYINEGDNFGADDLNKTNTAINNLASQVELVIPKTGWNEATGSDGRKYYYKTFAIGILETDSPEISLKVDENTTNSDYSIGMKDLNRFYKYKTEDGFITLYSTAIPTNEFSVMLKGVNV